MDKATSDTLERGDVIRFRGEILNVSANMDGVIMATDKQIETTWPFGMPEGIIIDTDKSELITKCPWRKP